MNSPLATCIIPTYNSEKSLPTLLAQLTQIESCEIILIDDGSVDHTVEVAKSGFKSSFETVNLFDFCVPTS